jgi:hypothetical protein
MVLQVGDPAGTERISAPLTGEAACRWSSSGQTLWVANGTGDEVRVELLTPDLRVTRAVTVPDEFGGSSVVLWIAAGQDGQQSWLIRTHSTELTAELLPADDCRPALFGPDGTWLLAADDSDGPGGHLVLLPGGFVSWKHRQRPTPHHRPVHHVAKQVNSRVTRQPFNKKDTYPQANTSLSDGLTNKLHTKGECSPLTIVEANPLRG